MMPLIKALSPILLRIFTVYGDIEDGKSPEPQLDSAAPSTVALIIATRRKRLLGLVRTHSLL
jgi:hypothetical protein